MHNSRGHRLCHSEDSCLNYPTDYMSNPRKYDAINITQTLHKNRIVTNNCRRLAISEIVHYFNSAMHLNSNIFTNLQIIWLLHKIGGKRSLRECKLHSWATSNQCPIRDKNQSS